MTKKALSVTILLPMKIILIFMLHVFLLFLWPLSEVKLFAVISKNIFINLNTSGTVITIFKQYKVINIYLNKHLKMSTNMKIQI